MYLIDTNVISEARKGRKANPGVQEFFARAQADGTPLFLSAITLGELRRGVELIRYRGDKRQAVILESWLESLLHDFDDYVLPLDLVCRNERHHRRIGVDVVNPFTD